ncbi:MAG TPA: hypothetical protein VIU15_36385 [Streptomyces sp.]
MSASLIELQPSKETVRKRPNRPLDRGQLPEWSGQDLEQAADRRRANLAAQIPQGLRARPGDVQTRTGQRRGEFVPDQPVADLREQAHRQQEVDPDPRGQVPQSALHAAVLLQDRVDELERHDLRQLAQMTRSEGTHGHGELAGEPRQAKWRGTMSVFSAATDRVIGAAGGRGTQRTGLPCR